MAALSAFLALALAAPAIARAPPAAGAQPGSSTIVEIVVSNPGGNFDVLRQAVLAADPTVLAVLDDNEPYTVFATLGVGSEAEAIAAVEWLPQGALTDILLDHVIDGRRAGTSVLAASRYDALLGETLTRSELGTAGGASGQHLRQQRSGPRPHPRRAPTVSNRTPTVEGCSH